MPVLGQSLSMLVNHYSHHLPAHLSEQEQIIEKFPNHTYKEELVLSGLTTFFVRQEQFCNNLFNQIVESEG